MMGVSCRMFAGEGQGDSNQRRFARPRGLPRFSPPQVSGAARTGPPPPPQADRLENDSSSNVGGGNRPQGNREEDDPNCPVQ